MCSSLRLSCLGLCASRTWLTVSFPMLRKFSAIMFCNFWSLYALKCYTFKGQSLENIYFRLWATFFHKMYRANISKHRQQSTSVKWIHSVWSQGCSSLLHYLRKGRKETLICPKKEKKNAGERSGNSISPIKYLRFNPSSQVALVVRNLCANEWDMRNAGSVPGFRISSEEGNVNPRQYSCLENQMNKGTWQVTFHRVAKTWAELKQLNTQHIINL